MLKSSPDLERACRLVSAHFAGEPGVFAYQAYDHINSTYFANELPLPLIVWALTPHGRAAGYTTGFQEGAPMVVLHVSTLGKHGINTPWNVPEEYLGWCFAYDVLLAQCISLSVEYRLGSYDHSIYGTTGTNNPQWVSEVNRIAPMLGMSDVHAGCYRMVRVPTGNTTQRILKSGVTKETIETKPSWFQEGNMPSAAISGFPVTMRLLLGHTDFYVRGELPFVFHRAFQPKT